MDALFTHHRALLDKAVAALGDRESGRRFRRFPAEGSTARTTRGRARRVRGATRHRLRSRITRSGRAGAEVSPWGPALGITYPAATPGRWSRRPNRRAPPGRPPVEVRVGLLIEALVA